MRTIYKMPIITEQEFGIYEEARKRLKISLKDKTLKNVTLIMEDTKLLLEKVVRMMDDKEGRFAELRGIAK